MTAQRRRIAGLGFHHGHIVEQLGIALRRDDTELVGVFHPGRARLDAISDELDIPIELRHDDIAELWAAEPEIVIVCSTTADHARWAQEAMAHGAHVLIEKPFASSAPEARRMIRAQQDSDRRMVINWPLAYYPVHRTTQRLIAEGAIGEIRELHYYDGNRGPFARLGSDTPSDEAPSDEADAWWLDPAAGGGALYDYLGYGTTLATWFLGGSLPKSVTAARHVPTGTVVDTHATAVASYDWGLATFHARWGTLTDPWIEQSLPRTGFVVVGSKAAIASCDYASTVRLHDRAHPEGVDIPVDGGSPTALAELIAAISTGREAEGPSSPQISLSGQRMVDAAVASAERGVTINLEDV